MARDFYEMGSVDDHKVKHDHESKFNKNDFMCNKPKAKEDFDLEQLPIEFRSNEEIKVKNIVPCFHYQLDEDGEIFELKRADETWEEYLERTK